MVRSEPGHDDRLGGQAMATESKAHRRDLFKWEGRILPFSVRHEVCERGLPAFGATGDKLSGGAP